MILIIAIISASSIDQLIVVMVTHCVSFQKGIDFFLMFFFAKDRATWARSQTSSCLDHLMYGLPVSLLFNVWVCSKMFCREVLFCFRPVI